VTADCGHTHTHMASRFVNSNFEYKLDVLHLTQDKVDRRIAAREHPPAACPEVFVVAAAVHFRKPPSWQLNGPSRDQRGCATLPPTSCVT
jgi:hypothetical protein